MMLRRVLCLAAAGSLVVAASACSDDDGGSGTQTPGDTPAATTEASPTAAPEPTVAVSPQKIVYEARDATSTNVWVISAVSGEATQLTFDPGSSGHPAWKPDYSRIIFSSDRGGIAQRNLFTMNPDGTDVQRLTTDDVSDHWAPKYSPDMTQITFVEVTPDDGSYMVLMNADGTNQRRITASFRFAEFPAWTRDGKLIYFAAIQEPRNNIDIFSVDPATGEVKVIVQTDASDVCPHFSRDGQTLTYASSPPGEPDNTDLFARSAPFDDHTDIGDDLRLTEDSTTTRTPVLMGGRTCS